MGSNDERDEITEMADNHTLRVLQGLLANSQTKHWPSIACYFLGTTIYRCLRLRLFEELNLRLKPFVVCAHIEGKSGLVFLHEILTEGVYHFRPIEELDNINLLYDVGANCGYYTLNQCARRKSLRAVCFEPHPETFCRLQRNLAANGLNGRVLAVQAAVGAASDKGMMSISDESSMGIISGSIVQSLKQPRSVPVTLVSLDDHAAAQNAYPDLLKIDVEGFEVNVLQGATKCLEHACAVILEVHSEQLAGDCLALLTEAKFNVSRQGDLLFAHKEIQQ